MLNKYVFYPVFVMLYCFHSVLCFAEIDRKALVTRHNVLVEGFDSLASLSVGNGEFAFTTDLTGLQTFYESYENDIPLKHSQIRNSIHIRTVRISPILKP